MEISQLKRHVYHKYNQSSPLDWLTKAVFLKFVINIVMQRMANIVTRLIFNVVLITKPKFLIPFYLGQCHSGTKAEVCQQKNKFLDCAHFLFKIYFELNSI